MNIESHRDFSINGSNPQNLSYIRPDLDDSIENLNSFLKLESFNEKQINEIKNILSSTNAEININIKQHLINVTTKLLETQIYDFKIQSKILWIIASLLSDKNSFEFLFYVKHFKIAISYIFLNDIDCFKQAIYLLNVITNQGKICLPHDELSKFTSLLQYPPNNFPIPVYNDYLPIIIKIITKNINKNVLDDNMKCIIDYSVELLKSTNDMDIIISLMKLFRKIFKFHNLFFSDDILSMFFSYANSSFFTIANESIRFLIQYVKYNENIIQITRIHGIRSIINIKLNINPKIFKLILQFLNEMTKVGADICQHIINEVDLKSKLNTTFTNQVLILNLIRNSTQFQIYDHFCQNSTIFLPFLFSFFESDDSDVINTVLDILLSLPINIFQKEDITIIIQINESNSLHDNLEITQKFTYLINQFQLNDQND